MTDAEEWREIPGFDGRYEVSSLGRVRSVRGARRPRLRPIMMKLSTNEWGHKRVGLQTGNATQTRFFVHRLVLLTFVGPCPDGLECSHNDGVPDNNIVSNLRWDTKVSNWNDKRLHGTAPDMRGTRNGNAKLTEDGVRCILAEPAYRGAGRMLARAFGVSENLISKIRLGDAWAHLEREQCLPQSS